MGDIIDDGEEGPVQLAIDKPRIRWTRQLHEHFLLAVSRLGGADKATPRLLMQEMGVAGLTLSHLKSHQQKHRLAKSRDSVGTKKKQGVIAPPENAAKHTDDKMSHPQLNETMLKKLEERIEVQKRLQMRVEAEGKYLQSLLKKAQEMVAAYGSSTAETGEVNASIEELVTAIEAADSGADSCLTSVYAAAEQCGPSEGSVELDPRDGVRRTGRVLFTGEEIDLNK